MKYQGSCHCGQIAFDVEGDIGEVLACNCSMCQRRGSLLWFVPRAALELRTPAEKIATYTFNKHVIQHHFCANCGIHPFGEGAAPNGDKVAAVNVRCIEGIDIDALKVQHYDGRAI
jgi:hypothetical protein